MIATKKKRVLAVASGGGHWVQLRRLSKAFEDFEVSYATVHPDYRMDVPNEADFHVLRDATRWDKWGLVVLACQTLLLLHRVRPDCIVTTGAAPGYLALRFGKLFGAKTVWIDSIANAEEMSLSGRRVRRFADLWLTQWEHLSQPGGPLFWGSVL